MINRWLLCLTNKWSVCLSVNKLADISNWRVNFAFTVKFLHQCPCTSYGVCVCVCVRVCVRACMHACVSVCEHFCYHGGGRKQPHQYQVIQWRLGQLRWRPTIELSAFCIYGHWLCCRCNKTRFIFIGFREEVTEPFLASLHLKVQENRLSSVDTFRLFQIRFWR